jgi:hypothetical protein
LAFDIPDIRSIPFNSNIHSNHSKRITRVFQPQTPPMDNIARSIRPERSFRVAIHRVSRYNPSGSIRFDESNES